MKKDKTLLTFNTKVKLILTVSPPMWPSIGQYVKQKKKRSQAYFVKKNGLEFTAQACG